MMKSTNLQKAPINGHVWAVWNKIEINTQLQCLENNIIQQKLLDDSLFFLFLLFMLLYYFISYLCFFTIASIF